MKIFSTIFLAFILISTFSAPQTAHAGFIADAVSSVVGAVGDAIGGAIDIAGNLIDNVTSITSGIFQGSINLITGGSFSDGYKQGFCNLGGGGYGILNGGGCDSSTQFWKIVSSSDSNGSITPAGTTVVEQGQSVVYKIVSGPITREPLSLPSGCVESMIPARSKILNVFLSIFDIKSAEAATTLALPSGGVNCAQRYRSTNGAGWVITSLMVDGVNQSAAQNATTFTYTFDTVSADHTISATFALASTPSVVEVFGVCDNTGGYNCAPGTASSQSGNATDGWSWNCDGTPNDSAHRATGCFFKPTPAAVTSTCTTVWTSNSKACNLYPGYTNYTGNVSFEYDSCNLNSTRNIDTSGCVAPTSASTVTCTKPSGSTFTLPAGSTCPTWTKYCTPYNDANPYQEWAYSNPLTTSSYWDHIVSEDWKCKWTPVACLTTCGASYPQTYTCGAASPGCGTNGASATCTRTACTSTSTCSNGLNISTYPSCTCPSNKIVSGSSCVTSATQTNGSCTPLADKNTSGNACMNLAPYNTGINIPPNNSGTYSQTCKSTCPGPTYGNCTNYTSTCWYNYCTGGNDVNGNQWQIWKCKIGNNNMCTPGTEVPSGIQGTQANGCAQGATPVIPGSGTSGGTPAGGTPVGGTPSGGTPGSGDLTCSKGGIPNTVGTCPNGGSLVCNTSTSSCQSAPNNCGLIGYGTSTVNCHGTTTKTCDAVKPANIPVTATIKAIPNRVKPNGQTTISLTATGSNTCTLTKNGQPMSQSPLPVNAATCTLNPLNYSVVNTVTDQSTYKIACNDNNGGNATATQIVNVDPNFYEF